MKKSGTLYLVSTPIGNLEDITARAIRTLESVDVIAAEDTRHSRKLLSHFGIKTPCVALYEDNEKQQSLALLRRLLSGESIAVISDAGTPLISDPGFGLVHQAVNERISVCPVPGVSACIAALSASGLPTDRFVFEGFLPHKTGPRKQRLKALDLESRTIIFYESVHRIRACLSDLREMLGDDRQAVVGREITKQFETFYRGTLASLCKVFSDEATVIKGEFVVIVSGCDVVLTVDADYMPVLQPLLAELPLKQAVALTTKITGVSRKLVYQAALALKAQGD